MRPGKRIQSWIIWATVGLAITVTDLAAQSPNVLHPFNDNNADGFDSEADLVLSGNMLYGTTQLGGTNGPGASYGTIFSLHTDGTGYRILYEFTGGADGAAPNKDLVLSGGTLYGTAGRGTNLAGYGSIFSVDTNGSNFTTIYPFTANTDGALGNPNGGLTLCGDTLYGTAYQAGISNAGSIFAVTTNGVFTLLHKFIVATDGENPLGTLVLSGGTLYGTARNGGTNGIWGTVYSISTNGQNFTVLHTFDGSTNDAHNPQGGVVLCGNRLYGTTIYGGMQAHGAVFAINTNGSGYAVLHSFNDEAGEGTDPGSGLVLAGNTLYGTDFAYSNSPLTGAIYAINMDGGSFTTLYAFPPLSGGVIGGTNAVGGAPAGTLAMAGNVLYGTTTYGGIFGHGTVYSLPIVPVISTSSISGSNLTLNAIDGVAGESCTVLTSTNLSLPVSQWTALTTNTLAGGGDFSITATNGVNPAVTQQFYLFQITPP